MRRHMRHWYRHTGLLLGLHLAITCRGRGTDVMRLLLLFGLRHVRVCSGILRLARADTLCGRRFRSLDGHFVRRLDCDQITAGQPVSLNLDQDGRQFDARTHSDTVAGSALTWIQISSNASSAVSLCSGSSVSSFMSSVTPRRSILSDQLRARLNHR